MTSTYNINSNTSTNITITGLEPRDCPVSLSVSIATILVTTGVSETLGM